MEGCCPTTENLYVYAHDCAPRFYLQKHTPMMKSRYLLSYNWLPLNSESSMDSGPTQWTS